MFDHIDLADQIGDRDVGRGEFFLIAGLASDPFDGRGVAWSV